MASCASLCAVRCALCGKRLRRGRGVPGLTTFIRQHPERRRGGVSSLGHDRKVPEIDAEAGARSLRSRPMRSRLEGARSRCCWQRRRERGSPPCHRAVILQGQRTPLPLPKRSHTFPDTRSARPCREQAIPAALPVVQEAQSRRRRAHWVARRLRVRVRCAGNRSEMAEMRGAAFPTGRPFTRTFAWHVQTP